MIKFLLDANLSPQTAKSLKNLDFDVRSITEERLGYLTDEEIVKIAYSENRIIITFDLDFGELYSSEEFGKPGVIVLRLKDQTVENVNQVLNALLTEYEQKLDKNPNQLVVVKENSIRFVS